MGKPENRDRTLKNLIAILRQFDARKLRLVYMFALHLNK